MKLHVKNVAKVKEASLALDGITVIAGENNCGKSTIGKVLFGVFDAISNVDAKIVAQKKSLIAKAFSDFLNSQTSDSNRAYWLQTLFSCESLEEPFSEVFALIGRKEYVGEGVIVNAFLSAVKKLGGTENAEEAKGDLADAARELADHINIPDVRIIKEISETSFDNIFPGQVNYLGDSDSDALIDITVKNQDVSFGFSRSVCKEFRSNIKLRNNAIFIDNPSIIASLDSHSTPGGLSAMNRRLIEMMRQAGDSRPESGAIERAFNKDKLAHVYQVLDSALDATIIESGGRMELKEKGDSFSVSFSNLSMGVQSLLIIKVLIERNILKKKDVLILDEPEIHLHPDWQVKYAHLIVLLQKAFDLTVLVATHSHFFADAINLYSKKYLEPGKARFYLANKEEGRAVFKDVTESIDDMYAKMADTVVLLNNLRESLD